MKIKFNTTYFDKLSESLNHLTKSDAFNLGLLLKDNNLTIDISYELYDDVVDQLYDIVQKDNSYLDLLEFLLNKDDRREGILI